MNRRHFLASAAVAALAPALSLRAASEGKFFTLAQRKGRWWLIKPDGGPFFSLGLNHIDPASLRYPENIHLWRDKYGGSTVRWLRESVAPNLKAWGFNTVGWVQEVTVRQWKHSRAFTHDEYRALGLPYCHLLPFTESHQWDKHTAHYDYRSVDWKEWCDYVVCGDAGRVGSEPWRHRLPSLRRLPTQQSPALRTARRTRKTRRGECGLDHRRQPYGGGVDENAGMTMNITFKLLRSLLLLLCALVVLARPGVARVADTDAYGGSTRVRWEATGWFRLQQNGGRFWLVTPEGHPFFNLGINHLGDGLNNAQRADVALATELTRRFQAWHFNTAGYGAGAPFREKTPFVSFLNLVPTSRFLRDKASFPDVFDAEFQLDLQKRIERQCRDVRDNPRRLGYMWTDTPLWNLKDARRTMWPQYPSAREAATAYGAYLRASLARPYIVGYNRCQIRDVVQPDGMLKQGILQRNGEPYPEYASQIAAFNRQTLDALYNGLKP